MPRRVCRVHVCTMKERFGGREPESGPHDSLLVQEAAGMEADMQLTLEYVGNIPPGAGGNFSTQSTSA